MSNYCPDDQRCASCIEAGRETVKYATIGWTPQDILDNVNGVEDEECEWYDEPLGWTREQAEDFLQRHELSISEVMIEAAGEYIREFAQMEAQEDAIDSIVDNPMNTVANEEKCAQ